VWAVAQLIEINPLTIRSWIKRGKITAACDVKTKELIVHAKEAAQLADKSR
jgi:predicted site-specific integrase-resolvase